MGVWGSEEEGKGLPGKLFLLHSYAWGWILNQQNCISCIQTFKKECKMVSLGGFNLGSSGIVLLGKRQHPQCSHLHPSGLATCLLLRKFWKHRRPNYSFILAPYL